MSLHERLECGGNHLISNKARNRNLKSDSETESESELHMANGSSP